MPFWLIWVRKNNVSVCDFLYAKERRSELGGSLGVESCGGEEVETV